MRGHSSPRDSRDIDTMKDSRSNRARFSEAPPQCHRPAVPVEIVRRVFGACRARGFRHTSWPAELNVWIGVMRARLPSVALVAIDPLYRWFIVRIPAFVAPIESPDVVGSMVRE